MITDAVVVLPAGDAIAVSESLQNEIARTLRAHFPELSVTAVIAESMEEDLALAGAGGHTARLFVKIDKSGHEPKFIVVPLVFGNVIDRFVPGASGGDIEILGRLLNVLQALLDSRARQYNRDFPFAEALPKPQDHRASKSGEIRKPDGVMVTVVWQKCLNGVWCSFDSLDLSSVSDYTRGVYVIWKQGTGQAVYVGQGYISDRIRQHRGEYRIARHGHMLVTWIANLATNQLDGVERFLADQIRPIEGVAHPVASPISVNIPRTICVFR